MLVNDGSVCCGLRGTSAVAVATDCCEGTCSQETSQFYLHTPRTSANEMNHCFAFPAEAGTHLPTPEGWKAELSK